MFTSHSLVLWQLWTVSSIVLLTSHAVCAANMSSLDSRYPRADDPAKSCHTHNHTGTWSCHSSPGDSTSNPAGSDVSSNTQDMLSATTTPNVSIEPSASSTFQSTGGPRMGTSLQNSSSTPPPTSTPLQTDTCEHRLRRSPRLLC
ncbi:hypothetical protein DAEQUDRAFT_344647 [Daedalea quercina L-15889]|uniref:Uncharacterized protein n=1 Tax=Daedalea quercina L-15889 TaxID=1314783 RepID=A0A165PH52_9APHY|nr:hypothetical protein DAEQUDRAFT_344647 [Daedalea quercina L-15889]